jgi:hypothetical protein
MSETGKLINGRAIAVVVAGVVIDIEELERKRETGKFYQWGGGGGKGSSHDSCSCNG